jgi:hypothetical protein
MSDTREMQRVAKGELLRALEETIVTAEQERLNAFGEGHEISEAERLAAHAEPPVIRVDGKPRGMEYTRPKALTGPQMEFTKGMIIGKTMRQAYRDAYPNAKGDDKVITSAAYRLSRDERVQKTLQDAWGETVEVLAEDTAAVKRYVLKELLAHSKEAKQEGSKLKALELMGKAVGMFKQEEEVKDKAISADQLKKELSGHLKLLDNIRPISKAAITNG